MQLMNTLCQNCRWWQPRHAEIKGECHANPPIGLGFPLTQPSDWCGRVEVKPQEGQKSEPRQSGRRESK